MGHLEFREDLFSIGCEMADESIKFEVSEQVMTGSKRASDDGQDVQTEDNGHPLKRPKQECDVHAELKILLPSRAVGAVIGSAGENIKRLRSEFSASLSIPDSQGPERILIIGATVSNICGVLTNLLPRLERDLAGSIDSEEMEVRMLVHQSHAGRIIGKGGEKVKKFRSDSGAHIKVFVQCCPHSTERVIQVSGQKEQVVTCIGLIMEDLVECGVKGVNMPYNPSFADENYSFEYGGYVDFKRRGGFGGRGRGFRGRSPMGGFGGRFGGHGPMGSYGGAEMFDDMGYGGYGGYGYEYDGGMEDEYYGYMDRGFGRGGMRGRGGRMMGSRGGRGGQGTKSTSQVSIPKFLAGAVIGKAGNRIKQIQAESGAQVKLDEADVEGEVRVISITGYPDEIQYAQYLLQQSARGLGGGLIRM